MPNTNDPPPPLPQPGALGAEGEPGTAEGVGGDGGTGGRGGRGGIGLTGPTGSTGPRGHVGRTGASGGPKGEKGDTGDTGDLQTRTTKIALAVVVAVVAASSVFYSTRAEQRLDEATADRNDLVADQAVFDDQVTCSNAALEQTLRALRARSQFAEQQADTTLAGDVAQRRYLRALLNPDRGAASGTRLTRAYLVALGFKITATREQLITRANHPFPTLPDVTSCGGAP